MIANLAPLSQAAATQGHTQMILQKKVADPARLIQQELTQKERRARKQITGFSVCVCVCVCVCVTVCYPEADCDARPGPADKRSDFK